MSSLKTRLRLLIRHYSGQSRRRGALIKKVAKAFELVYFGTVYYDDEMTPIKGFTLSTSYLDQHFSVGHFDGYAIRLVDRYDTVAVRPGVKEDQNWLIVEISLESSGYPRTCLVPTGPTSNNYARFFTSHTKFQPLNSTVFQTHSPEVHGRFQIIASPSRTSDVEEIFTTPIIMGIAGRFWPHGIEVYKDKLYIYITNRRLSVSTVAAAIDSALWLAQAFDADAERRMSS